MATLKLFVIFVCVLTYVNCFPAPEPGFHNKHEHFIINVPYKVHTVHHHHISKVPVYKEVPVIKHVPVYKEVHVPVYKEVHVPVVKEVHVPVPIHYEHSDHNEHKGWSSSSSSDWY